MALRHGRRGSCVSNTPETRRPREPARTGPVSEKRVGLPAFSSREQMSYATSKSASEGNRLPLACASGLCAELPCRGNKRGSSGRDERHQAQLSPIETEGKEVVTAGVPA